MRGLFIYRRAEGEFDIPPLLLEEKEVGGPVDALDFCPNGEMLASCSGDNNFNVNSVDNDFSLLYALEGHLSNVNSLSFSPDSTSLVSSGLRTDDSIILWNLTEGTLLTQTTRTDNYHNGSISTVAHLQNGNLIASGGEDFTLHVWDAKTLEWKFAIADAHVGSCFDLVFSGSLLISSGEDAKVTVTNIKSLFVYEKRFTVLLALIRLAKLVDEIAGDDEKEKFEKAKQNSFDNEFAGRFMQSCLIRGDGAKGV